MNTNNNTDIAAQLNQSNYQKSNFPGSRKLLISIIKQYMGVIVAKGGNILLSARQVLDVLQGEGILSTAGVYPKGANGIGDILGAKHFKLPFLVIGTSRAYLIPAVRWTADEVQEFDALTTSERAVKLQKLEEELLKKTPEETLEVLEPEQEEEPELENEPEEKEAA